MEDESQIPKKINSVHFLNTINGFFIIKLTNNKLTKLKQPVFVKNLKILQHCRNLQTFSLDQIGELAQKYNDISLLIIVHWLKVIKRVLI